MAEEGNRTKDLENLIFGGDDDANELSDFDDEHLNLFADEPETAKSISPVTKDKEVSKKKLKKKVTADLEPEPLQPRSPTLPKQLKFKKKKVQAADEDGDGVRSTKKVKRARRRQLETTTEADDGRQNEPREEMHASMREFEDTVASLKPKRRKNEDFESTDMDDAIAKLESDMRNACADDIEANRRNEPATAKLKMLSRVVGFMEKSALHETMMENDILSATRMWLEPLPDGSLPALDIRRQLLQILSKMPIKTDYLRESRLGRVIMFMYKCEKETPELKKIAGDLINKWCRPILARAGRHMDALTMLQPTSEEPKIADRRNRVGDRGFATKHATIPQAIRQSYVHMPRSSVDADEVKARDESRFKHITQQLNKSRTKVDRRLNKISAQGRDKAY